MTRRRENSFLRVFLFTVNMIARLAIEVYNIVYASKLIPLGIRLYPSLISIVSEVMEPETINKKGIKQNK